MFGFFGSPLGPQDGFLARLPILALVPAPAGSWLSWLLLAGSLLGAGALALRARRRSSLGA